MQATYPGTLTVDVDLTDLDRKVMGVRQTIPVRAGALTLLYPQWMPGNHAPRGAVNKLAGLQITALGKPVTWKRDMHDMHAFHVTVPEGAGTLHVAFQFLSPLTEATGRVVMTQEIVGLQWNTVLLYPAGVPASGIQIKASARLPAGWKEATALNLEKREGQQLEYRPTSLERLVDSPLWAGKYTQRVVLDNTPGKPPVILNLFADAPSQLEAAPEHLEAHRRIVTQADALFASRHFGRYEFLLALSESFSGIGLEHSESSENALRPSYFTEWKKSSAGRSLLTHEFAHSWNGKFRRPADLATPHYNMPVQDSLLWIYEGQTTYWGQVLAVRAGMVPMADAMEELAQTAASLHARAGRTWRNLQDTTNEPVISLRGALDWPDWQRREEYYNEGSLVWLDVDTKIRELTAGRNSLDDVARNFFGVDDGRVALKTYTFEDFMAALNQVAALDWAGYLRARLDANDNQRVLDGLTRAGWQLVFTDKQSEQSKAGETTRRGTDFSHSLGFDVDRDGKLVNLKWEGPAFKAGLTAATQLVAVNGLAYKVELLREAITAAKDGRGVELLVKVGPRYRTVKLDYRGGLRYPKLERIADKPDLLTPIFTALK